MKISHEWLSEYVDWIEQDPEKIADALTKGMGEIDETEDRGRYLRSCVVGSVTKVTAHPNADKLSLCDVETEQGTKRVVCGGTNLREGMLVAFAHVGATVRWHGTEEMTLSPVKIRGEKSEGMICAGEELGIEQMFPPRPEDGPRPITDLSDRKFAVGTPLREALGMDDIVYHIDNHAITNRPDLFSHLGVARECVALGLARWKNKASQTKHSFGKEPLVPAIRTEDEALTPRYLACLLSIDDIGETPDWMKRRLEATGWRSLNLPIDITNYVAMEHGMPLHSFDAQDITGDIVMRRARQGERIETLDGKEHVLPEGAVVMSDDAGIFDLLGIMGGKRSATKETTKHILLHSAIVDPVAIRRTVIATGVRTDAATVYEKGIPRVTCRQGFERAVELFLELIPGARIVSALHEWGDDGTASPITLEPARTERVIGTAMKEKRMEAILTDLGCAVKKGKKTWDVTPPLWRLNDLTEPADLIEEIARIEGYNTVPPAMPSADISPPARDVRLARMRAALKEEGFYEMLHLAFVSPASLERCAFDPSRAVRIANPLGEELSLLRPSLLPHLLATATRERARTDGALCCYEYGRVFVGDGERTELVCLFSRKSIPSLTEEPALRLKTIVEEVLSSAGYALSVEENVRTEPHMHPGRSVSLHAEKTPVGTLFEIHPSVLAAYGLPGRTAAAVLNLDALLAIAPSPPAFRPLPQFPAVSYDETLPLTDHAKRMLEKVRGAHPLLETVRSVDLFSDASRSTITLRFTYRSEEKTLTEEEVALVHASVVSSLRS